jgi:hypothetical protein
LPGWRDLEILFLAPNNHKAERISLQNRLQPFHYGSTQLTRIECERKETAISQL